MFGPVHERRSLFCSNLHNRYVKQNWPFFSELGYQGYSVLSSMQFGDRMSVSSVWYEPFFVDIFFAAGPVFHGNLFRCCRISGMQKSTERENYRIVKTI